MASGPSNSDRADRRPDNLLDIDEDEAPIYFEGRRVQETDEELARAHPDDEDEGAIPSLIRRISQMGQRTATTTDTATNFSRPQYLTQPYDPYPTGQPQVPADLVMDWSPYDKSPIPAESPFTPDPYTAKFDDQSLFDHEGEHGRSPRRPDARKSLLGAGLVSRVKSTIGLGKDDPSEMDLPLRERAYSGANSQAGRRSAEEQRPKPKRSRTISFWPFGRKKNDDDGKPRYIYVNQSDRNQSQKFVDNHVSTAKYNAFTFLPKFLYEQFSKYANLFFLITAMMQQIPDISPTNRYTTILPLTVVLLVSAIKEQVEDGRRKASDRSLNNSSTQVLRESGFEETKWVNVAVGDVVRVKSEEPFPADLALVASSEPEGLCYIETANLDGETNLKIKQALPETAGLVDPSDLRRLDGHVESEHPNSSLYTFEATITIRQPDGSDKVHSLGPEQLLLRGATLRNTPWIHGIVIFTGHESKLMRNATATPIKKTAIARMLNIQILMLGAILVTLSVISSVGDIIVRTKWSDRLTYLGYGSFNGAQRFFSDILTYWVLYSNLVPISLFVTLEMVQYVIAFLIDSDLDIYHKETDTPANCRTSSLVEELGQIEYIFSDKTGTLTCNQMEFKQCTIGGIQYGNDVPDEKKASAEGGGGVWDFAKLKENRLSNHPTSGFIHEFLTVLSICHTVIPERTESDTIKYQAASPDEGALVEGAVGLDYQFVGRSPRSATVRIDQDELTYQVLAVCEFNSTRKRMSVIFKCPDGKIRLYCKGADTVILKRLDTGNEDIVKSTLSHLEDYAADGLRTLCLSYREVPQDEFDEWIELFNTAQNTVSGNRADELDKAAEIIECKLTLLGATAIEDKLQEGVPETIRTLQEAGIKIWVLTGDRQETAINIGMSCKLISEDMTLLVINEETAEATRDNIEQKSRAIIENQKIERGGAEAETLALVIDGQSLKYALERDLEKQFLDLAVMCKAVICCRVSPLQKALVVKLVKRHLKAVLLAIGDGANDVSMIQAAHIGVGISGLEGLQAARSADVSIAQFRYLQKLLLIHGSWSYSRVSRVILYSFYKNVALFMTQFWYSFQNSFSGQIIYESWTLSSYNVFFTFLPPFVLGIFDQFISARHLHQYPQLYQLSQKNMFFKMHSFVSWVANGFYHSLLLFFISQAIWLWDAPESNGHTAGHWVWGTSLYTAALITVLGKAALITNMWTKWTFAAIPGSFVLWAIFLPVFATVAPMVNNFAPEYNGVLPVLMSSPRSWLMWAVLPVICLLRDFAWKYAKRMYFPQPYHHVQEIQKYNVQDYRPRMEQFQKAIRKVRQVHRMRKQRGFAFSKADESESRVLQAYDTSRDRGKFGEMPSQRPRR